jgi:hypothetical protein
MIHTNFISSYHHIAKGIHQLQMPIPLMEMPVVDRFLNSHNVFLDYDDGDQIKVIREISECESVRQACQRMTEFYVPDNTG